jgi:hypothetical protein
VKEHAQHEHCRDDGDGQDRGSAVRGDVDANIGTMAASPEP